MLGGGNGGKDTVLVHQLTASTHFLEDVLYQKDRAQEITESHLPTMGMLDPPRPAWHPLAASSCMRTY